MAVNKTMLVDALMEGHLKVHPVGPAGVLPCLCTPQSTPFASVSTVTVAGIRDDSSPVGSTRMCLEGTEKMTITVPASV